MRPEGVSMRGSCELKLGRMHELYTDGEVAAPNNLAIPPHRSIPTEQQREIIRKRSIRRRNTGPHD